MTSTGGIAGGQMSGSTAALYQNDYESNTVVSCALLIRAQALMSFESLVNLQQHLLKSCVGVISIAYVLSRNQ